MAALFILWCTAAQPVDCRLERVELYGGAATSCAATAPMVVASRARHGWRARWWGCS